MELIQIGHQRPVLDSVPSVVHEDALSVALVCMPWAVVDMPSLALSTIAPLFEQRGEVEKLDVVYGNIRWLDFLVREVGLERDHYELIVDAEVFGVGEWVFSSCFRPGVDPRHTSFYELVRDSENVDAYCAMFRAAPAFIGELARDLVASGVDVLGLTTTFDQNIASFALAHRVKELSPSIVTLLGGANCDGVQGTAVHRARAEFDYVIRGEAERSIAPLIAQIAGCRGSDEHGHEERLRAVPSQCWRSGTDGASVATPSGRRLSPLPSSTSWAEAPRARKPS